MYVVIRGLDLVGIQSDDYTFIAKYLLVHTNLIILIIFITNSRVQILDYEQTNYFHHESSVYALDIYMHKILNSLG